MGQLVELNRSVERDPGARTPRTSGRFGVAGRTFVNDGGSRFRWSRTQGTGPRSGAGTAARMVEVPDADGKSILNRPDAELVSRCLDGDTAAWEGIVRLHHQRVYNLAYRYTGKFDEAEDLTQEIFFKVFRTLPAYRTDAGTFVTWLLRVSRNHIIDRYRKFKTERSLTGELDLEFERAEHNPARFDSPGEAYRKRETADIVHRALLGLGDELREAVILRDIEGCTYDEMAVILSVPLGTVKSRINRGRTELGRRLRSLKGQL